MVQFMVQYANLATVKPKKEANKEPLKCKRQNATLAHQSVTSCLSGKGIQRLCFLLIFFFLQMFEKDFFFLEITFHTKRPRKLIKQLSEPGVASLLYSVFMRSSRSSAESKESATS